MDTKISKGKTDSRNQIIKFRCTTRQKCDIESHARAAGAASVSQYLITLALQGDTREYAALRRRARKPLDLATIYHQLGHLVLLLESRSDVYAAIELIQKIRRGIAIGDEN